MDIWKELADEGVDKGLLEEMHKGSVGGIAVSGFLSGCHTLS